MLRRRNTLYGHQALPDDTTGDVVGSTQLYEADGQIRFIPMPTPDPKGTTSHFPLSVLLEKEVINRARLIMTFCVRRRSP